MKMIISRDKMSFEEIYNEMVTETSIFIVNHFVDISLLETKDAVLCSTGRSVDKIQQVHYKKVKEKVPYLNTIILAAGSFDEHYRNALYNGTPTPVSYEERIIEYLEKCDINIPC